MGRARKITVKTYTVCGNPQYMPPEMLKKHGYTKTVDFWQLGVLTYHLLTGYPPFAAEEHDIGMPTLYNQIQDHINTAFIGIRRRILNGNVAFPWQIPIKMHHFVRALLEPVPENRLGMGRRGLRDIFEHTCFEGFDWDALKAQRLRPPVRPTLHGANDLRHYQDEIPKEDEKQGATSAWCPTMW